MVSVHPARRCTSPLGVVPVGLGDGVGDCHDVANFPPVRIRLLVVMLGLGWLVLVVLPVSPIFCHSSVSGVFRLGRVLRTTLPTAQGGVVHLFVVYDFQGAEEDAEKLQLTDRLLQAVFAEAQVVCIGQPLLIAGNLNADPAVIPCLSKSISAGRYVDLALAFSLGELVLPLMLPEGSVGRKALVLVGISLSAVPMRWLLQMLALLLIGGSLLTFQFLLAFALVLGWLTLLALL